MKNIVFFDGVCNLCNFSVDLIIRLDKKKIFHFTSLQGNTAKQYDFKNLYSVIYVNKKGHIYDRSDAIIHIGAELFWFGKIAFIFKICPKFIRDFFYNLIAKNRYRLFGKRDTCRMSSSEERDRFLD